ncbi:hypothetical protein Tco_0368415 [Tanacetum coccineum]
MDQDSVHMVAASKVHWDQQLVLKVNATAYADADHTGCQDTRRSTSGSAQFLDPKGVIYKDQMNRNRLMRADELHKFSDGTLDDVRSALNDIAKDIDKQLYERRLMQNLEKFIGGREYGNDLRLLEWTI